MLAKAAVDGKLATRADASKHQGDLPQDRARRERHAGRGHRPIERGGQLRGPDHPGRHPAKITDTYNGDFNTIKNNLNTCIDAVNALVADAGMLAKAAVDGKLATRADASKHQGDYRKIVQGVNDTLDAVIGPLNVSAKYVDRSARATFPRRSPTPTTATSTLIKNNLNTLIAAMNDITAAAEEIANGNLTVDASRALARRTS